MLKVKTYVKQSTVPGIGLGLFAGEDIAKGTIIWQFNHLIDKVIPVNMLKYIDAIEAAFLKTYAYRSDHDMILCSDDGKYINHSKSPNVDDIVTAADGSISIANRDISMGEEMFCDYTTFDDDSRNGVDF